MSRPDLRIVTDEQLDEYLAAPTPMLGLKNGDGGGRSGGMEIRVTALENDMKSIRELLIRIESKLDTKASSYEVAEVKVKLDAKASSTELAELKGKLESKASTSDLGLVLGKIEGRPTTLQVLSMVILLGGIMAGSQIIKTVYDIFHSIPTVQSTK